MVYYLDNAATTKPYQEVVDTVSSVMLKYYGNPSSTHKLGEDARKIIENVRYQIAEDINCDPSEIIFTSGAAEANSLAYTAKVGREIISTNLEHKSIELLNKFSNCFIDNDKLGNIDLSDLERKLKLLKSIRLKSFVSIHGANSEIGVIQDIKAISDLVHKYDGILHIDATQLYAERRINVKKLGIDLMSVSAQKFGGGRGAGFLYCKSGTRMHAIIAGTQERGMRGGTYNTAAIAGMGKALEITRKNQNATNHTVRVIRNKLADKLLSINGVFLNGPKLSSNRLSNNLSLRIDGIKANDLVTMASMYDIYISAGSACSSGEAIPSSALKAIGLTDEEALSTIRITVGHDLSNEDIDNIATILSTLIKQLRKDYKK